MKPIVILSGPVGAGKTTVAKELVDISPPPVVYIEGDKFWRFIAKGGEKQGHVKNFRTIMVSMMAAALPYARAGYEVIVDFSIPPWFLDIATAIVKVRDIPLDYVIIKPSLGVCAARAAARAEGTINDYTAYGELYADFEGFEQYTISDDENDVKSIARRVRKELDAGRFHVTQ